MIVIKNLNFSYRNKKILKNFNLNISMGEWVTIIGNNGSGKTTLARILMGLLQPNEGKIFIDGKEFNEDSLQEMRSYIGMVFQNPDYQFVGSNVLNDIVFGLENQLLSREEMQKKLDKYTVMLNIQDLLDKNPQNLSGGQKQKVAIASVLAMEPKIIILDEPTAFLDPQGAQEIFDIIYNIKKNTDKILIIITHDLNLSSKSDKILFLEEGNLVKYSPPVELFSDNNFCEKYFNYLPLALKIHFALERESDIKKINKDFFYKLKGCLWEYIFEM
ncbi:ABC-type cobalt transport system ATP-binding protein [Candidatus Phytoplasma luffae]|uniref:ABC-type cobalt transport system ATP-binding protein n=1 Tax=Loofah witches'-broom phytoplasma TaxID=35773 RepID=A0A975FI48_LOWBP|nr:ATP-binding cassette domain-containing protein [Candidatus Phytoplasma luffae]QTX02805.1 ABC-type cobalt transport system ATP-binding protein [Candidatus Phytoplasma luffae]